MSKEQCKYTAMLTYWSYQTLIEGFDRILLLSRGFTFEMNKAKSGPVQMQLIKWFGRDMYSRAPNF